MFHTLSSATFKQVGKDSKPLGVQLPMGKNTRFCGARARSNTGCFRCRKRKKKCDEVHPKCANCKTRDEICEWPKTKQKSRTLPRSCRDMDQYLQTSIISTQSAQSAQVEVFVKSPTIANTDLQLTTPPASTTLVSKESTETASGAVLPSSQDKMKLDFLDNAPEDFRASEVVQELKGFREDLANFQMELEQLRSGVSGCETSDFFSRSLACLGNESTELLTGFALPYLFDLDKEGLMFLDCYTNQYSTFVSIGLDTLNYFRKTFLSIAALNEGITYALAAWGGFYLELRKPHSNFTRPWEYMQKATKYMCKQMGDYLKPSDKHQFFVLFAFYLIFIGIEVCTGDVRNWRGFMTQCSLLIRSFGGILRVADLFGYSNDIKWLISDFKFHDLLSSNCLLEGPVFPVKDYENALAPRPEYGIDPLHGVVGPLYDIMGAIGKSRADLSQKWAVLERKAQMEDPCIQALTSKFYKETQDVIDKFKLRLASSQPLPVHLDLLRQHAKDRDLHVALFELYTYICKIQLATSLEKLPPNCIAQQHLLHQALRVLDVLQESKMKVSLLLALLVCGMTCCAAHDRALMTQRFRLHLNQYEIGNLQRVEETVVEAWARNPTGSVCIDWAEFVRDKEWHLYVG